MTLTSRRDFLRATPAVAAAGGAAADPEHGPRVPDANCELCVADFGAVGDGTTPCADAFQRAIDQAASFGGGFVRIPPGKFLLERTPLVASRVHLMGAGPATILRGQRPDKHHGAALISNEGQQSPGYEGAHDWSISHVTIDSPHTNGIVVTHAARVYIGFIYGVDVYHHFVDTAGRDILCENLYLTGRSGTSTFQVDSLSGAQTIWDGKRAVSPLLDGTDTEDLILRNSIITATSGHTGSRPQHDVSVHFHGDHARGFLFSDLILGGAACGFYQDADTAYHDLHIANVRCFNPGHAVLLNPGKTRQRRLMIRGLSHCPGNAENNRQPYRGIDIHGRADVLLSDIQLDADAYENTDYAVRVTASEQVGISGLQARGRGGCGIVLQNGPTQEPEQETHALIQHCQFEGFETGCRFTGTPSEAVVAGLNLFKNVAHPYQGVKHTR